MSQSLWNRAVSFDFFDNHHYIEVIKVSIPLEQGSVFRRRMGQYPNRRECLNPFGTGQCLSTVPRLLFGVPVTVSIPLEQGSVFRRKQSENSIYRYRCLNPFGTGQCLSTLFTLSFSSLVESQSLWNRAVSFDKCIPTKGLQHVLSQSLWNRAVSFDCSGILKPCGTRLTRATSQLFPRLRELGLDLIKCCTSFNILFTYQAVENGRDFTRVFRFY